MRLEESEFAHCPHPRQPDRTVPRTHLLQAGGPSSSAGPLARALSMTHQDSTPFSSTLVRPPHLGDRVTPTGMTRSVPAGLAVCGRLPHASNCPLNNLS